MRIGYRTLLILIILSAAGIAVAQSMGGGIGVMEVKNQGGHGGGPPPGTAVCLLAQTGVKLLADTGDCLRAQ